MKIHPDHSRTTLTFDERTIDYLKFLNKFYDGIWIGVNRAIEYFRPDYQEEKHFRDNSTIKINKADEILAFAKELEKGEKSRKGKLSRKIRKSIVIDKYDLYCVNKVAKTNKVKRDYIIISAIKYARDAAVKLNKLDIEMHKKLLEKTLIPMLQKLESDLNSYLEQFENYMKANNIYDVDYLYSFDFDSGLLPLESYYQLIEDIEKIKKTISSLEEVNDSNETQ